MRLSTSIKQFKDEALDIITHNVSNRKSIRLDQKIKDITESNFKQYIIAALKIPLEVRDPLLIQILSKATSYFEFFSSMSKNDRQGEVQHRQCCERMLYQENKRGELIIKHLDLPDKFYIILEGQVAVFIQRFKQGAEEEAALNQLLSFSGQNNLTLDDIRVVSSKRKFDQTYMNAIQHFSHIDNRVLKYNQSFLKQNIQDYDKDVIDKDSQVFQENGVLNYKYVANQDQGTFIGELAILDGTPRNATIIAHSNIVKLAYLTKNDFKNILMEGAMAREREKRKQFFQKNVLNGDPQVARQLGTNSKFYNFESQKFNYGTMIFKEGDLAKYIYVVKTGEVTLLKVFPDEENQPLDLSKINLVGAIKPYRSSSQNPHPFIETLAHDEVTMDQFIDPKEKIKQKKDMYKKKMYKVDKGNKLIQKKTKFKIIQIGVLTEGEFLGEQEIFTTGQHRQFSALVTAEAVLFKLDLATFSQSIDKTEFKDLMLKRSLGKSCLRQQITLNNLEFWETLKGPQIAQALYATTKDLPKEVTDTNKGREVQRYKLRSVEDMFKYKASSQVKEGSSELTRQLQYGMSQLRTKQKTYKKKQIGKFKSYEVKGQDKVAQKIIPLNKINDNWGQEYQDKYNQQRDHNLKFIDQSRSTSFSIFKRNKTAYKKNMPFSNNNSTFYQTDHNFLKKSRTQSNFGLNPYQNQQKSQSKKILNMSDVYQQSQFNSIQIKSYKRSSSKGQIVDKLSMRTSKIENDKPNDKDIKDIKDIKNIMVHQDIKSIQEYKCSEEIKNMIEQSQIQATKNKTVKDKDIYSLLNSKRQQSMMDKSQGPLNLSQSYLNDKVNQNDSTQKIQKYQNDSFEDSPKANLQAQFGSIDQHDNNQKSQEYLVKAPNKDHVNQLNKLKQQKAFRTSSELFRYTNQFQVITPLIPKKLQDQQMLSGKFKKQNQMNPFALFTQDLSEDHKPYLGHLSQSTQAINQRQKSHLLKRKCYFNKQANKCLRNLSQPKKSFQVRSMSQANVYSQSMLSQNQNYESELSDSIQITQKIGKYKNILKNDKFDQKFDQDKPYRKGIIVYESDDDEEEKKEYLIGKARKGARKSIAVNRFRDFRESDGYLVQNKPHVPNRVLMSSTHNLFRPAPQQIEVQRQILKNMY